MVRRQTFDDLPANIGPSGRLRNPIGLQRRGHRQSLDVIGPALGRGDWLLIIHDTQRLQLVSYSELFRQREIQMVADGRGHRAPLVCHFHDAVTRTDFLVMLDHLARHDVGLRKQQAECETRPRLLTSELPIHPP